MSIKTEKIEEWRKVKVSESSYKIVDDNDIVVAESIMNCDIDLLLNAQKIEDLLVEVWKAHKRGKVINDQLAAKISTILEQIEGVSYD